jgi:hypothetical protein
MWVGAHINQILLGALYASHRLPFVQVETLLKTPIDHVARGNYEAFEIYAVASK